MAISFVFIIIAWIDRGVPASSQASHADRALFLVGSDHGPQHRGKDSRGTRGRPWVRNQTPQAFGYTTASKDFSARGASAGGGRAAVAHKAPDPILQGGGGESRYTVSLRQT